MAVGRTIAAWTWLVVGTLVWGTTLVLLAPFDGRGTLRWRCVRAWGTGLSTIMGLERLEVAGRERETEAERDRRAGEADEERPGGRVEAGRRSSEGARAPRHAATSTAASASPKPACGSISERRSWK